VPHGTFKGLCQDIERGILIAIKDDPTVGTDVGPHTQTFLDAGPARRAVSRRPFGGDRDHRNVVHHAIRFDPGEELPPSRIVDGLGKVAIPDHIADLEVFKGNQIARCDERVRRLPGEIFALPLHLQMRFDPLSAIADQAKPPNA